MHGATYNFRHCTHHEQGNRLLGKFSLYSSFFTALKKNRLRMIISTWRKQPYITYQSLGLLQRNKDFWTPLEQANKMMSRVLLLRTSFTKKETLKKVTESFQQYANMHPMYLMLYTANLGLCDYVLFSQIRSPVFW